jgi:hypothetical protein
MSLPKQLQWASHDRPTSISTLNSNNTGKGLCYSDNTIPDHHDAQSNHKEWSDLEQRYRQVNKVAKLQRRFRARIRIPSWLIAGRDFELCVWLPGSLWLELYVSDLQFNPSICPHIVLCNIGRYSRCTNAIQRRQRVTF